MAAKCVAKSDTEILDLALKVAPDLHEHIRATNNGMDTTDGDIALGLIIHAAAAGIIKYCTSGAQVFEVTQILQFDLASKVADLMTDGRPVGRLHS